MPHARRPNRVNQEVSSGAREPESTDGNANGNTNENTNGMLTKGAFTDNAGDRHRCGCGIFPSLMVCKVTVCRQIHKIIKY